MVKESKSIYSSRSYQKDPLQKSFFGNPHLNESNQNASISNGLARNNVKPTGTRIIFQDSDSSSNSNEENSSNDESGDDQEVISSVLGSKNPSVEQSNKSKSVSRTSKSRDSFDRDVSGLNDVLGGLTIDKPRSNSSNKTFDIPTKNSAPSTSINDSSSSTSRFFQKLEKNKAKNREEIERLRAENSKNHSPGSSTEDHHPSSNSKIKPFTKSEPLTNTSSQTRTQPVHIFFPDTPPPKVSSAEFMNGDKFPNTFNEQSSKPVSLETTSEKLSYEEYKNKFSGSLDSSVNNPQHPRSSLENPRKPRHIFFTDTPQKPKPNPTNILPTSDKSKEQNTSTDKPTIEKLVFSGAKNFNFGFHPKPQNTHIFFPDTPEKPKDETSNKTNETDSTSSAFSFGNNNEQMSFSNKLNQPQKSDVSPKQNRHMTFSNSPNSSPLPANTEKTRGSFSFNISPVSSEKISNNNTANGKSFSIEANQKQDDSKQSTTTTTKSSTTELTSTQPLSSAIPSGPASTRNIFKTQTSLNYNPNNSFKSFNTTDISNPVPLFTFASHNTTSKPSVNFNSTNSDSNSQPAMTSSTTTSTSSSDAPTLSATSKSEPIAPAPSSENPALKSRPNRPIIVPKGLMRPKPLFDTRKKPPVIQKPASSFQYTPSNSLQNNNNEVIKPETTTSELPKKDQQISSSSSYDPFAPLDPKADQWGIRMSLDQLRQTPSSGLGNGGLEGYTPGQTQNSWGAKAGIGILGEKNRGSFGAPGTNLLSQANEYQYTDPATVTQSIQEIFDTFDEVNDGDDDDANLTITAKSNSNKGKVEGLTVTLLPHQIKGLKFLKSREAEKIKSKGGLLCDDMGLGKTVQSIALILTNSMDSVLEKSKKNTKSQKNTSESPKNLIKTTLVVAPLALIHQWASEIKEKAPSLRVLVHHGPSRDTSAWGFENYDVIVTTYQIVVSEFHNAGPLFQKQWWRIIVDEAHTIKNSQTKSAKAAYQLLGDRRWCLTGTPIQNNIDELQSLIRFLNIGPYNDYGTWATQISRPISSGNGVLAAKRLHAVLAAIMLRRRKDVLNKPSNTTGKDGDNSSGVAFRMKERRVHRINIEFSKPEKEIYKKFEERAITQIDGVGIQETGYIAALVLLLRLRQICDHVKLVTKSMSDGDKDSLLGLGTNGSNTPTKMNNFDDGDDDDFLSDILGSLSLSDNNKNNYNNNNNNSHSKSILDAPSAKMRSLLSILNKERGRKTIIFSQFTSFLDILEPGLSSNGFQYVRYDGSMSSQNRESSLQQLRENPRVTILLCSLKAGALGLNLTCASQVILMDPWWNPMISEQAIDRVHRIGQTRDVDVYEMMVISSVEERIMALQEKKRQLAQQVIENKSSSSSANSGFNFNKLSFNELLHLFKD